jgi:PAS domain-containing protein
VQQNLVLILARELADKLASAMFVVDGDGRLAYFNERAADILGEPFSEVGRIPMEDWSTAFKPTSLEGEPLDPESTPLVSAVLNREPAHMTLRVVARDGTPRNLAVTAFPLFAHEDELVGAAAIFWELPGGGG